MGELQLPPALRLFHPGGRGLLLLLEAHGAKLLLTYSVPEGLGRPAAGQAPPASKGGFEELPLTHTATPLYGSQP